MAPYPIFFTALKTIITPNFMLLTESEQLKHISALLGDILLFFFVVHQIQTAKRPTSKLFFYTYISPFETRKINRRFSFLHETQ